jgi:hypothetical protein
MARRNSLDQFGFSRRARRGARAENAAFGYSTKAAAIAQWRSPPHAANIARELAAEHRIDDAIGNVTAVTIRTASSAERSIVSCDLATSARGAL